MIEEIRYKREICPACNGSGEGHHEKVRCFKCNGRGEVIVEVNYEDEKEK